VRIHVVVLPVFAIAFELVDIGEGGPDDDEGGAEADEAEEGHKDVGSGDFHVSGLIDCIQYSGFREQGKGRLTG